MGMFFGLFAYISELAGSCFRERIPGTVFFFVRYTDHGNFFVNYFNKSKLYQIKDFIDNMVYYSIIKCKPISIKLN